MINLVFWHWWLLGVVLIILEAFVPGTFFLWMGVSAGVVGLLLLVFPGIGWEYQVLIFAVFSIASISLWMIRLRKYPTKTELSNLNKRAAQLLGRSTITKDPIVNGLGTINIDDTIWRVLGPDCPSGTMVKIIGAEGTELKVEMEEEGE